MAWKSIAIGKQKIAVSQDGVESDCRNAHPTGRRGYYVQEESANEGGENRNSSYNDADSDARASFENVLNHTR